LTPTPIWNNLWLQVIQPSVAAAGVEELHMIEQIFAMYGAASAMATLAFLVLCLRAVEAKSND
jgi:hypothetical protein